MKLLLDIDGVLVTTPGWRVPEFLDDGFMKFNEKAAKNLARIIDETGASIVLVTSHRIMYSEEVWMSLFATRGIFPYSISKVNHRIDLNAIPDRATEIIEWVTKYGQQEAFIVLDDDLSLHGLPLAIKSRCVLTQPLLGLTDEATARVLELARDFS